MSIHSLKHRIQKRVKGQQHKHDYSDIGSFIKRKRKELDVTQDEIAKGICSISYLSKIENNQIIPSEFYVKELMAKLDIDEDVYTKSLRDKEYVTKMIRAFYYMEDDRIKMLYEEIKDIEHNIVINLCKLGYIVYFGLDDDNQYVMMLEHVINNMTDMEVQAYLYFASIFFMEHNKYKTALELIMLHDQMTRHCDYLAAMFYELSYVVKQRLGMMSCASDDYQHAILLYTKYHNVKRVIQLALRKVQMVGHEHPKNAYNMLQTIKMNQLSDGNIAMYHFIKAELLFHLKRYQEATFELKHIKKDSLFYFRKMTLLLRICVEEEDTEMIQSIRTMMSDYKPHKQEMKAKVYYHFLLQDTPEEQKEYLRDIAIPFAIKIEDYKTLYEYTMRIMDICIEHSRYKEATQYFHKYEREMRKVRQLLY